MCGIVGLVRLSQEPLPPRRAVHQMASAIAHRGPDGFGEYRNEFVHIASVRLAVLDVEHGLQPATNESKSLVAVYNGELYNYRELASSLRDKGHRIESSGDTAVLPHLLEEYGSDFIKKLRGMFAFALWDSDSRRLILVRDRVGIKPLFYAVTQDYLIFSSEIKGLFASELINFEIDRDSIDDLFSCSYPFPPRTMFKGISELLPAHTLSVSPEKSESIKISRYWRAPFDAEKHRGSHAALQEEFSSLLETVVQSHLISDVKVGTYLSGGVDSSTITALAQKHSSQQLDAFTISFPENRLDEGPIAQETAERFGVRSHLVPCGKELTELFLSSIYHTEIPLQYPLASYFLRLSKSARERGVKVILTGEGADEQLAGYECFRLENIRRTLDYPGLQLLRGPLYNRIFSWLGSPKGMSNFFADVQKQSHAAICKAYHGVRPPWYDIWHTLELKRKELLAPTSRRSIRDVPQGYAQWARKDYSEMHPLDAALAFEFETRLPCWTVLIDDRAAMANGVETRVPFLDHVLVEWICKLPPKMKLNGLKDKYILRESTQRLIPNDVRKRPKRPFYAPISDLFFGDRPPEFVSELLSESSLRDVGIFTPTTVTEMQKRIRELDQNSFEQHRLEWLLILVLGTQALPSLFSKPRTELSLPPSSSAQIEN
jgi:asparagine synthase (glutamine-hydrolysing)